MFDHILVPLDQSSLAEFVLPHAAAFAEVYDADVKLVHVMECPAPSERNKPVDPLTWEFCRAEADSYLKNISNRFQEIGLPAEAVLLEGQPAKAIIDYARTHHINLIMMSSHGKTGMSRWNVNSVGRKILQASQISSFIVRAYNPAFSALTGLRYRRLLVPLDGSLRSECVLPTAETFARRHRANLLLGHVVVRPEMPRQTPLTEADKSLIQQFVDRNLAAAEGYFDRLLKRLTVDFIPRMMVSENIAISLHQLVEDEGVDLVIISAHGHSGYSQWPFGSLASSFIEYGTTPLLIVQDLPQEDLTHSRAEEAARETKGH